MAYWSKLLVVLFHLNRCHAQLSSHWAVLPGHLQKPFPQSSEVLEFLLQMNL